MTPQRANGDSGVLNEPVDLLGVLASQVRVEAWKPLRRGPIGRLFLRLLSVF